MPGRFGQLLARPIADPGVMSSIAARAHTFAEIDHEIFPCHSPSTTGPRSAVGNVSGNRCESYCRSRGLEFDPGPVPYFRGD